MMSNLSIFHHRERNKTGWPFSYSGEKSAASHDRQVLTHPDFGKIACYCSCGWSAVASYGDRPAIEVEGACLSAHKIHVSCT